MARNALDLVREAVAAANATEASEDAAGTHVVPGRDGIYVRVAGTGPGVRRKEWCAALAAALDERGLVAVIDRPADHHMAKANDQLYLAARPVTGFFRYTDQTSGRRHVTMLREAFTGDATSAVFASLHVSLRMALGADLDSLVSDPAMLTAAVTLEGERTFAWLDWAADTATAATVRPASWRSDLDRVRALVVDQAADLEHAFARVARVDVGWATVFGDVPAAPAGDRAALYYARPTLWPDQVGDVHGLQVLTARHLDRAHDLSDWMIRDVGDGRFLVEAPDLAPWYDGPEPRADILARARADFGAMIVTADDIASGMIGP